MNSLYKTPISTSTVSPKIATTFEYRQRLGNIIISKHPDRIPIIVEIQKAGNLAKQNVKLTKTKFLVSNRSTVGHFISGFKNGHFLNGLNSNEGLYFFFGDGKLASNSMLMENLYKQSKEDDGFLYCYVDTESTFGSLDVLKKMY